MHDLLIKIIEIADYHDYTTSRVHFKVAESLHGMFLVRKKNTKGSVWQNFGLMAKEDGRVIEKEQIMPICRTCGKGVLAKGSNTTNLFQHLREHHPQIYADLAPSSSKAKLSSGNESTKQPTLEESITQSAKYLSDSAQAKKLNRAVTYYNYCKRFYAYKYRGEARI